MASSLLRTDREIADLYTRHGKTVYRVCYAYMKKPKSTVRNYLHEARAILRERLGDDFCEE